MMDDSMQQTFPGDVELTRRLEAFAAARLSPDAATGRRMRARVMREARARFEAQLATAEAAAVINGGQAAAPVVRRGHPAWRRVAGLLLAAALSVSVVGGAALAATPGGPLYGAALWIEELRLPAAGDARSQADLARLDRRLEEARAAAAGGNSRALAAALAAYRETVDDAIAAAGTNDAWLARLEAALGKHLAVLTALTGKVPEQARGAIEQAIVKSSGARDRIGGPDRPKGPNVPGVVGPTRTPGNEPAPTPKPASNMTPKPAKTPAPEDPPATEAPRATARPDRTPQAGPPASPRRADR
jgi:hypothetical protein